MDEVGGGPRLHHLIEIAHGAHPQYLLPAVVLLEYLKHLVLVCHLGQHAGKLEVGNAQQQPVKVFL